MRVVLLGLGLLFVALVGCEKLQEAIEKAATPPATEPPPRSEEAVEADELNNYVDCYNRTMSRTRDSAERYFESVSRADGPDCARRKGSLYALYDDSVEVCNKAAAAGQSGGPSHPELERAVAAFAAANAALVPLVSQADAYWSQEDYKADNCARGKALHRQLVDAFDTFETTGKPFSAELDRVKSDADQRALERVEQRRGKNYEWHVRHLMLVAKAHIQAIPESDTEPVDKEAYLKSTQALETAHDALAAYAAASKAEIDKIVFMGSGFEDDAKEYWAAAELVRRALEADRVDERELNSKVDDLVSEYNDLVGASNRMTFEYAQ